MDVIQQLQKKNFYIMSYIIAAYTNAPFTLVFKVDLVKSYMRIAKRRAMNSRVKFKIHYQLCMYTTVNVDMCNIVYFECVS